MTAPRSLDSLMAPPELAALYGGTSTYLAVPYPVSVVRRVRRSRPTPLPRVYPSVPGGQVRHADRFELLAAAVCASAMTLLLAAGWKRWVRRA